MTAELAPTGPEAVGHDRRRCPAALRSADLGPAAVRDAHGARVRAPGAPARTSSAGCDARSPRTARCADARALAAALGGDVVTPAPGPWSWSRRALRLPADLGRLRRPAGHPSIRTGPSCASTRRPRVWARPPARCRSWWARRAGRATVRGPPAAAARPSRRAGAAGACSGGISAGRLAGDLQRPDVRLAAASVSRYRLHGRPPPSHGRAPGPAGVARQVWQAPAARTPGWPASRRAWRVSRAARGPAGRRSSRSATSRWLRTGRAGPAVGRPGATTARTSCRWRCCCACSPMTCCRHGSWGAGRTRGRGRGRGAAA